MYRIVTCFIVDFIHTAWFRNHNLSNKNRIASLGKMPRKSSRGNQAKLSVLHHRQVLRRDDAFGLPGLSTSQRVCAPVSGHLTAVPCLFHPTCSWYAMHKDNEHSSCIPWPPWHFGTHLHICTLFGICVCMIWLLMLLTLCILYLYCVSSWVHNKFPLVGQ